MSDNVEYRPVVGFPGYRVGSDGSIQTCWKRVGVKGNGKNGSRIRMAMSEKWKPFKGFRDDNGYWRANLSRDGKKHTCYINRLVAEAFKGECPVEGWQAAHEDGDNNNNNVDNINWKPPKANAQDRIRHGTQAMGDTCGKSKLCSDEVLTIRWLLEEWEFPVAILCKIFGVSDNAIKCIRRRKTWKHI